MGGGMIGCEAAEFLGERGHRVAVVEMREDIAADVRPEHRRCLLKNLRESQVLVRTGARGGAVLPRRGGLCPGRRDRGLPSGI